jgi:hypothetical protein
MQGETYDIKRGQDPNPTLLHSNTMMLRVTLRIVHAPEKSLSFRRNVHKWDTGAASRRCKHATQMDCFRDRTDSPTID